MAARLVTIFLLLSLTSVSSASETKDITYRFPNSAPVTFSHKTHLRKYNNNCRVCHNAIFDLKNRRRYTMAEMEMTKSCGGCHTGVKAFSVADEKKCHLCHTEQPRQIVYTVKGAPRAEFSHQTHTKATGGKCKSCHNGKILDGKNDRGVSMAQMEKGRTCGACHNDKSAFTVAGNCGKCHKGMTPKDIAFKTKGVTDAIFSHKAHLAMYGCKDCHTGIFPYKAGSRRFSMTDMEKGKSCGSCHNGSDAFASNGDCAKCHLKFKPKDISYPTDMGKAVFSHNLHLEMFKCTDCHTGRFPYKTGVKSFTMGEMEEGKSCGGCHDGKTAFSVKDQCNRCHDIK
jgi:c(7)-type cytochrome triheme protein